MLHVVVTLHKGLLPKLLMKISGLAALIALFATSKAYPDSKVHGANMEPIWGQ